MAYEDKETKGTASVKAYSSIQELEQHCGKKANVLDVSKGYGDTGKNALEVVSISITKPVTT